MKQLSLFREIIVDNFAGGGGASTGIEMATGMSVDIAINHDPAAIEMHKLNHPDTEHYCESVWDVDPVKACRNRKVGLAWFSPDCKHFSKAKGGKPVDKNIRGLAWVAVKWAIAVKPRVIMLENVEEFKTWGPIDENGKPIKWQIGVTFNSFIKALEVLGYRVEFKELRACDYGSPTTRKRFFMIARSDGRPIVWPEPTHGDPNSEEVRNGILKPWRTAAEIIDWSIETPSIFERKKPLSENTLKRIARGIQRFVINEAKPFIVRIGQTGFGGDKLQYSLDKPLTTITTKAEHCLVTPYVMVNTSGHPGSSINSPLKTITTGGHHALVSPILFHDKNEQYRRVLDLKKPLNNKVDIVSAFIAKHYGDECSKNGSSLVKQLSTRETVNHNTSVTAFLTKYYGSDIGQSLDNPLHTITTKDRFGLVTLYGEEYRIVDIGMRMLQPHELYAAQGFPTNYLFNHYNDGRKIPKYEQVKRVGNSVPPDLPEALVRANLPEFCASSSRYAI